jgi:hypothetical protein
MKNSKKLIIVIRKRDPIARDLLSPKYRMRVVEDKRKREPKHKEQYDLS